MAQQADGKAELSVTRSPRRRIALRRPFSPREKQSGGHLPWKGSPSLHRPRRIFPIHACCQHHPCILRSKSDRCDQARGSTRYVQLARDARCMRAGCRFPFRRDRPPSYLQHLPSPIANLEAHRADPLPCGTGSSLAPALSPSPHPCSITRWHGEVQARLARMCPRSH